MVDVKLYTSLWVVKNRPLVYMLPYTEYLRNEWTVLWVALTVETCVSLTESSQSCCRWYDASVILAVPLRHFWDPLYTKCPNILEYVTLGNGYMIIIMMTIVNLLVEHSRRSRHRCCMGQLQGNRSHMQGIFERVGNHQSWPESGKWPCTPKNSCCHPFCVITVWELNYQYEFFTNRRKWVYNFAGPPTPSLRPIEWEAIEPQPMALSPAWLMPMEPQPRELQPR